MAAGQTGAPVDGRAVDERRELAQALPEGVADGAEGQHDVHVLAHLQRKTQRPIGDELGHRVTVLLCIFFECVTYSTDYSNSGHICRLCVCMCALLECGLCSRMHAACTE